MTETSARDPLLPRHLAERALAQRENIEGERKLVTILFADLVGSTALAGELDPEDMVELLNGLFERWVDAVHRFEGIVDKFLGDGMLALFGAPLVHEDDPRRAVLAALEIRDQTAAYSSTFARAPLDVRIGINTGTVVVGTVGSDARMEYTAIGDAVNVAQRVESSARAGSVFLAPSTYELVAPYFAITPAGEFTLKGKPEPVPLYEATADLGLTTAVRGVAGLRSPIVGRTIELAELQAAIGDLREGKGSAVAMVGEPGLGKSRLLAESRAMAAGLLWAEGHALSYGASTPYLTLAQIVRGLAPETDDRDLSAMLAGSQSGTAEGRPERIVAALRAAVLEAAPLVIAVEDLHWLDEASRTALEALAPVADAAPVLFLATSRPAGRKVAAGIGARVIEIDRLPHEASFELIRNLLHIDHIPDRLRDLVLDRAQGNPFFVEEFLRMLIGDGILTRMGDDWIAGRTPADLSVPPTLEALMASRIDRLASEPKRLLQAASVLGRQFGEAVLSHLVDSTESLPLLHSEGFLLRGDDDQTHVFKHVITQEVAYESALKRTRRKWHLAAGEAIEGLHPDEVEMRAAELGHHFDAGGDAPRAAGHLALASRRAADSYANEAALELSGRALELTEETRLRFDLMEVRSRVLNHLGRHDEEADTVDSMTEIAGMADDGTLELRALECGVRLLAATDYVKAYPLIDRTLEVASRMGDRAARARTLRTKGLLERWQYAPERALVALEESVELFGSLGMARDKAAAMAELATTALSLDLAQAPQLAGQALDAAREARDPQLIAGALVRRAGALHEQLDLDGAADHAEQALEVATTISDSKLVRTAHIYLGHIYADVGRSADSDRHFLDAQRQARAVGDALGWLSAALGLVECWEADERFVELLAWLTECETEAPDWNEDHNHAYIHYALGYRALRWFGRYQEAVEHLRRSVAITGAADSWNPPAVMFRNGTAWVLTDLGDLPAARELLEQAKSIAAERQLEPVTLGYLLATEARLSIRDGALEDAAAAIQRLREFASPASYRGERHAADFLAGELALARGEGENAFAFASRASEAEQVRIPSRWFSKLEVLDLVARAAEASGVAPDWPAVAAELDRRMSDMPEECREPFLARSDVRRMVEATRLM